MLLSSQNGEATLQVLGATTTGLRIIAMDEDDALLASASGIIQCLRLLADEAAVLRLHGAVCAIRAAMQAVALECEAEAFAACGDLGQTATPFVLH